MNADIGREDIGREARPPEWIGESERAPEAAEAEVRRTPFFKSKWHEWERFKHVIMIGLAGAVAMFAAIWFITY